MCVILPAIQLQQYEVYNKSPISTTILVLLSPTLHSVNSVGPVADLSVMVSP